jgi:hypothetical protein
MAYRNYSVANGFTVATDGSGDFTTIAAALTAASSGMDIFIRPGTYTENLTLKAGVNIVGFTGDESTPNVTIIGKLTYTVAGTCTISNIRLQTNSDFFLVVSGSSASIINLKDCTLNCSNNTGISYTSSSASSQILIDSCTGLIGTTGITYFVSTASGNIIIRYSSFGNGGATTTASSTSTGQIQTEYTRMNVPISATGTSTIQLTYSIFQPGNNTAITTSGTSNAIIRGCRIGSGTASALSIGSGTSLSCFSTSLGSSNTNAVAGAGNFIYAGISFDNTSNTLQNTLTLQPLGVDPANAASGALLASTGTNTSPAYTLTPSVTSITLGGGTALANYVEGTFTPGISFGNGTTGIAYSVQSGKYTRIGNVVYFALTITTTSKGSSTGTARITGLPITVGAQTGQITFFQSDGVTPVAGYFNLLMNPTTTSTNAILNSATNATGGSLSQLTDTNFINATTIRAEGFYFA